MITKTSSSGYFHNGLPYNRAGHGSKPLVIFQGLMFVKGKNNRLTIIPNRGFEVRL